MLLTPLVLGLSTVLVLGKRLMIRVLQMTGFSDRRVIQRIPLYGCAFDILLVGHTSGNALTLEARTDYVNLLWKS